KGPGGFLGGKGDLISTEMAFPKDFHRIYRHQTPLTDDADSGAGPFYLLKNMAGEQDGLAPALVLPQKLDKPALHEWVQAAGGLIQNQNLRVMEESGNNAQLLLHPLAHLFDFSLGVQLKPVQQFLSPVFSGKPPVLDGKIQER